MSDATRSLPPGGFPVVFGHQLVGELPAFVHRPYLVVTMADLWPQFEDRLAGPHLAGVHLVDTIELDDLVALERDASRTRTRSSGSAAARRSTSRSSSPGRAGCRSSRSRPRRRSTRRSATGPASATTAASATSAGRSRRPSTSTST